MAEFSGAEFSGAEFTGERVIPELVDANLFNEHFARYRFALRFVIGLGHPARILDAGCGSGYGAAELAGAASGASVLGADLSAEAIGHARLRYGHGGRGALFLQAACEALPFSDAMFDLVVAFEVIEHLEGWRELLTEASRVLKPWGILLVSTPNRDYYAESRGNAGPNPFHRHEFNYADFHAALGEVFPHVGIWTQNHEEAIVFSPESPQAAVLESSGSQQPAGAHFYLAACSQSPITANETFAWLPSSANILRERERHIAKLEGELGKKDEWLRQTIAAHSELQARHEALTTELERQNTWAEALNRDVAVRNQRITELQNELEVRLAWIGDLESEIERARAEIGRPQKESSELSHAAQTEIERLEATVTDRTLWAQRLDVEIARIQSSKWFRIGAKLGIGPRVRDAR